MKRRGLGGVCSVYFILFDNQFFDVLVNVADGEMWLNTVEPGENIKSDQSCGILLVVSWKWNLFIAPAATLQIYLSPADAPLISSLCNILHR